MFINPLDAEERGLKNGQKVKIYNERGTVILPCRITERILPGVVNIPQGAWWKPDKDGNDIGGSVNTLTSERWTPFTFGNAQHTIMAEVAALGSGHEEAGILFRFQFMLGLQNLPDGLQGQE